MSVPLPVDADDTFVKINAEYYFVRDERYQPLRFTLDNQHVIRAGFHQIRDVSELSSVAMFNSQAFEIRPVVAATIRSWKGFPLNRNLAVNQHRRLVPVVDALKLHDNRLAVALALADCRSLPVSFLSQIPAIVIKNRFAWLGIRVNLDPAFNPEKARNPAQNDGLFKLRNQLAA